MSTHVGVGSQLHVFERVCGRRVSAPLRVSGQRRHKQEHTETNLTGTRTTGTLDRKGRLKKMYPFVRLCPLHILAALLVPNVSRLVLAHTTDMGMDAISLVLYE